MPDLNIRPATLDDATAITEVHCSTMTVWRDPNTRKPVPYASLDLFGRWYNGGPWMSVETCAIHLDQLLRAGHLALVAEVAGKLIGEAEYYVCREPGDFASLHLAILYIHAEWQRHGAGKALLAAGSARARALGLSALTTQPEDEARSYYRRLGFALWQRGEEYQFTVGGALPEGLRRVETPPPLPETLALRVGRYQCGAQDWETLWPYLTLPGWSDLQRGVWQGRLAGQPAILGLREQLHDPTQADGYAWLPPDVPLAPAVAALRALAAQGRYQAVDLLLPSESVPTLKQTFRFDYQATIELWRLPL